MLNIRIVGVLAGILAATGALTACGSTTADGDSTGVSSTSGPLPQVRERIAAAYQRWSGTAADFQAASVLEAHANNGSYHACMRELGYLDYHWETSIHLEESFVDDGTWETGFLAPLNQRFFTEAFLIEAHGTAMASRMNNIEMDQKENSDGLECMKQNPSPSEASVDSISRPPELDRLREAWEKALSPITAQVGTIDDYKDCLSNNGIPGHEVGKGTDPISGFQDHIQALLPDWRTLADPQARAESSAWRAVISAEDTFLEVDALCREPKIERYLLEVAALVPVFAAEHAHEIEALEAHWSDTRERAGTLGWSPDAPLGARSDELVNNPLEGVDEAN